MIEPEHWKLERFGERLAAWIEQEEPNADLSYRVTEWVMTRDETPYQGAHRATGIPNLWETVVPQSADGGRVVHCSYWIYETHRTVVCNSLASLSWPV
ncbi:MAG TPA: hypothetical protein VLJ59_04920 [Mycobacteriales bacterium]|nr:hypothetical protein [Mycobacteriales bacterium]